MHIWYRIAYIWSDCCKIPRSDPWDSGIARSDPCVVMGFCFMDHVGGDGTRWDGMGWGGMGWGRSGQGGTGLDGAGWGGMRLGRAGGAGAAERGGTGQDGPMERDGMRWKEWGGTGQNGAG